MQKRIINDVKATIPSIHSEWLDIEALAEIEISSENPEHPIEAALLPGLNHGWRAGEPGKQTIRVLFKQPQHIRCIQLEFLESAVHRTQEYVLRISKNNGESFQETLRQQWNFSPEGAPTESETHFLELSAVNIIELIITPDINNPMAFASLEKMRVS